MEIIKVIVNLSKEVIDAWKEIATDRGTTMTEVLRQAIAAEYYIWKERSAGGKILVEKKSGEIREIVFK